MEESKICIKDFIQDVVGTLRNNHKVKNSDNSSIVDSPSAQQRKGVRETDFVI